MANFVNNDMKMRRGQALNLAVATACSEGKANDNEYIIKQFLRYLQLAGMVQKANPDQLAQLLKSEKMIELLKQVDEELKE